jgi:DnaJ-domain-containing protein 1|tara:strand:+ start:107 stop:454 length:348 start_codon:yes stop_codon:yes gene_type:complete
VPGDLFNRLFELTRAYVGSRSGSERAWENDTEPVASTRPEAGATQDPELARYYANLEIPYGSDIETVRAAWKRMMKKYHPDLHSTDPQKRQVADELSAALTRAYQELIQVLERQK